MPKPKPHPQKEKCPNCGKNTLGVYMDPHIGGFVRCSSCGWELAEAEFDEGLD